MGLGFLFDVERYGDLGVVIKLDRLYRADLHPRQPDVVAGLQSLDIIEKDMHPEAFDKGLVLAADGKDGDDQDGYSQGDEDADSYSFCNSYFVHAFSVKL